MQRFYLFWALVLISIPSLYAQNTQTSEKTTWHGYTQLRLTSNFGDVHTFSMRRLKLWVQFGFRNLTKKSCLPAFYRVLRSL